MRLFSYYASQYAPVVFVLAVAAAFFAVAFPSPWLVNPQQPLLGLLRVVDYGAVMAFALASAALVVFLLGCMFRHMATGEPMLFDSFFSWPYTRWVSAFFATVLLVLVGSALPGFMALLGRLNVPFAVTEPDAFLLWGMFKVVGFAAVAGSLAVMWIIAIGLVSSIVTPRLEEQAKRQWQALHPEGLAS